MTWACALSTRGRGIEGPLPSPITRSMKASYASPTESIETVDITEAHMTDILIRDAKASRVGLSRAEYRRRALDRERTPAPDADPVTASHLQRFADLAFGLGDPEVMSGAWT